MRCQDCGAEVTEGTDTVLATRGPNLVRLAGVKLLVCDCATWFTADFVRHVAELLDGMGPAKEGERIHLHTMLSGGDVEVPT